MSHLLISALSIGRFPAFWVEGAVTCRNIHMQRLHSVWMKGKRYIDLSNEVWFISQKKYCPTTHDDRRQVVQQKHKVCAGIFPLARNNISNNLIEDISGLCTNKATNSFRDKIRIRKSTFIFTQLNEQNLTNKIRFWPAKFDFG